MFRRGIKRQEQKQAFASLGKIKVGKISEKGYPTSLDYFRFVPNIANHAEVIKDALGEQPKSLEVFFISDEHGVGYKSVRELRDGQGKLVATMSFTEQGNAEFDVVSSLKKGDVRHLENGIEKVVYKDEINYDFWSAERIQQKGLTEEDFAKRLLDRAKKGAKRPEQIDWQEILVLRFIITKLPMLGYWEFRTKGVESTIPTICGTLEGVMNSFGTICRIPFDLSVRKSSSDKAGDRRSYPVVSLVLNLDQERAEKIKNIGAEYRNQLLTASKIDEITSLQIAPPSED